MKAGHLVRGMSCFLFFEKYTIDSITIVEFIMYNKNRN